MVEFLSDPAAFAAGTTALGWLSRKPLRQPGSHGFYRFFAWEAILGLVVLNRQEWGAFPESTHQTVASALLALSVILAIAGLLTLRALGKPDTRRDNGSFYEFEKTTQLVTGGIFGYIRHPMYTSLLALAWGGYLQDPGLPGAVLAVAATGFLWLTARTDERECLAYFGPPYAEYMKRSKRFIPFLL
jgi:protein-S-isoprenylcysteine O-methyltransferase Ste14